MPDVRLLLPPNRSALESAVVQALHTQEHPERTLTTLYRADTLDAQLLPWLAWSQDVLAWPNGAGDTLRRNLTGGAWRMHRRMGTLAGLREVAGYFGATITSATVPPAKTYLGTSLTNAERDTFLQRYPQLRIYPQRLAGQRVGAMLVGLFAGARVHPVQTDAALRSAPQAFIYRNGVETALQAIERTTTTDARTATTFTEVRVPGRAASQGFCGRPVRCLTHSDAAARMYRLAVQTPYIDSRESLRRVTLAPGLGLINVRYDWVAGRGLAQGVHAGGHVAGYLRRSSARERIHKRLWLFDPTVDVARRGAASFCDASTLSMPAHHAQLSLALPARLHPRVTRGHVQGFLVARDRSAYTQTLQALRRVARASDRIAIDTAVHQPLAAGVALRAGAATAGEWRAP